MEIISYVLEGALEHKDSMGNGSIIRPGEVQRLSAGRGITHSEYNHSSSEEVHFLQIWFLPDAVGVEPGYAQKAFSDEEKRGQFRLVASRQGREGSLSLHQDVDMSVALVDGEERVSYPVRAGRALWVQVARGEVLMNGELLKAGDGVALADEPELVFEQGREAEVILFDMQPLARH
jgi:redox-sensitive bicupin YhaK (pirin superfamily)